METQMKLQYQVRQQAEEMQDVMRDLSAWEGSIRQKDKTLKKTAKKQKGKAKKLPPVRGFVTSTTAFTAEEGDGEDYDDDDVVADDVEQSPANQRGAGGDAGASAAAHTYDKGYKKWEQVDWDKLAEDEDADGAVESKVAEKPKQKPKKKPKKPKAAAAAAGETPATVVAGSGRGPSGAGMFTKGRKRAKDVARSREEVEREDGNKHFRNGDFAEAVKCYTRCVALNPRNAIALSNRAMAQLRLNEYIGAEADASAAIRLQPTHVKSFLRRGTARNALGRHREAQADFEAALEVEPSNRQAQVELRKTKDMRRTAIHKAPRRRLEVVTLQGAMGPEAAAAAAKAAAEAQAKAEAEAEAEAQAKAEAEAEAEAEADGKAASEAKVEDAKREEEAPAAEATATATSAGSEQKAAKKPATVQPPAVPEESAAAAQPTKTSITIEELSDSDDEEDTTPVTKSPAKQASPAGPEDAGSVGAGAGAGAGSGAPASAPVAVAAAEAEAPAAPKAKSTPLSQSAAVRGKLVPKVPRSAPTTSYDFERAWRSLRKHPDLCAQYLQLIKVSAVGTLFRTGINCDVLLDIIRVFEQFLATEKPVWVTGFLAAVTKTRRFDIARKFFSKKDKASLRSFFEKLAAQPENDASAVAAVRAAFKCE